MRGDNASTRGVSHENSPGQSRFVSSNLACARSIARQSALSIDLDSTVRALQLGLRVPEGSPGGINQQGVDQLMWPVEILRGLGDAIALVASHHSASTHQQLRPTHPWKADLFDELELARCEAIGAKEFSGLASNMAFLRRRALLGAQIQRSTGREQLRIVFGYIARTQFQVPQIAQAALQALLNNWQSSLQHDLQSQWMRLQEHLTAQELFALESLALIETIDWHTVKEKQGESASEDELDTAVAVDDDEQSEDANDAQQEQASAQDKEKQANDVDEEQQQLINAERDEPSTAQESIAELTAESEEMDSILPNRDAPVSQDANTGEHHAGVAVGGYRVFSKNFDEIVHAQTLATDLELAQLREALDILLKRHENIVGRLAGRLQRLLMSKQQRHWQFDLDEGQLDTARLTRVVTQPLSSLTFKQESDIDFKDTAMTLLVDNSKSMLGKPINIAAACCDILAQTLERCGITVEILGFTTTELHGGDMVARWQAQGAKPQPGRLNGLRHIIYKSADMPYARARKGLGLMLRKDLLKQNIDGEALLWAHSRLAKRPEQRKVLMVISDGAPIDTSTMSANVHNFLVDHLHEVVNDMEAKQELELMAIGIGHDVSQYYSKAITIYDPKHLSKAMLEQFVKLFE